MISGVVQGKYPPLPKTPAHVGIIMDGNGRWARARGKPRLAGHRAGVENLRRILRAAVELGVPVLTLYAFSTENWRRPETEVQGLLRLLSESLVKEVDELHNNGVQLRHIGDLAPLSIDLQEKIHNAIALTRNNNRLIANIAFNYGGRAELIRAVQEIVRSGIPAEEIDVAVINAHLYTGGLPDPDLIIRTSGEFRVSNFLIWQGAYAEYYVTPVLWPDFDQDEFYRALQVFAGRNRRYGGIHED
ncbi:MAG: di-trans,poly-cis-decaprenylcistransferase [Anaerolineae bacterium]|nr:di-trans,poly-cis-decaprenylcistransferase [Anaerolineae bacterium]